MIHKVITVKQPWARLIAQGGKKYRKPYLEDKLPGAGPYTCKFHSR